MICDRGLRLDVIAGMSASVVIRSGFTPPPRSRARPRAGRARRVLGRSPRSWPAGSRSPARPASPGLRRPRSRSSMRVKRSRSRRSRTAPRPPEVLSLSSPATIAPPACVTGANPGASPGVQRSNPCKPGPSAQMWYIGAPAARASASATSAIVDSASTDARRPGRVGEDARGAAAHRPVEQLDDLEHGHLARRRGRSCSRP